MKKLIPQISEKSMAQAGNGWYSFTAPLTYTKPVVADLIRREFKAKPLEVRCSTSKPEKRRRGKYYYETKQVKKFIVKMPEGTKIASFEVKK